MRVLPPRYVSNLYTPSVIVSSPRINDLFLAASEGMEWWRRWAVNLALVVRPTSALAWPTYLTIVGWIIGFRIQHDVIDRFRE